MTKPEPEIEEYLAVRKTEGLRIDPNTAEVTWVYGQILDPYGITRDLPEECDCVGRLYFARTQVSELWVEFGDLPDETRNSLWEIHKQKLAFPAGLPLHLLRRERES
jgi:hypothetical protein